MTTTMEDVRTPRHDAAARSRGLLGQGVARHWPVAVGLLAAAGSLASGAGHLGVLVTLLIACFCYLAAAATGRAWVSWAAIPVGTAVVVATAVAGAPWWSGLAVVSLAAVALGVLAARRRRLVLRQAVAALLATGVVVLALALSPTAAVVVAGLGLAAHAGWDAWHLVRREVVPRSLAVACLALDVPLGLGAVVLALL